jgi:hypothetical protein
LLIVLWVIAGEGYAGDSPLMGVSGECGVGRRVLVVVGFHGWEWFFFGGI